MQKTIMITLMFQHQLPAQTFNGGAGPDIIRADLKNHGANKLEDIFEHQRLHFAVNTGAPICRREEGPANFDFIGDGRVIGKARATNDFACCCV